VQVNQGVFAVLLGNQTSLVGVDFNQASQLRIEVNGISKLVELSSVPAAILAQKVVQDSDTLKALGCASGQLAKSTGSNWECADGGTMGPPGQAGPPGQKGENGEKGSKGEPGTKGDSGIACWDLNGNGQPDIATEDINLDRRVDVNDCKGPKGDKGDPGPKGATGATGQRGATGAPGQRGATGNQGPRGYTGSKGAKGDKGDRGYRGYAGAKGDKGDRGDRGYTGSRGPQGPPGKLSYTNEYSWYEGTPHRRMLHKDKAVCFLTYITGKFEGAGEYVYTYTKDGYWYLGGNSQQWQVMGKARCISW